MKNNSSRKLLFTAIAIVVLTLLSGLVINLLTGDEDFNKWLKTNGIGAKHLIIGTVAIGFALISLAYLQFRYAEKSDKENEILTENIEPDVKKLFDSLKERYQKRYESKLDERFEITLEVNEDWDGNKTQTFNERYDKDAKISEAFPTLNKLFEKKDGLLIVGEPGAGKTVLLLKIALNLLEKTNLAAKEPFPVIFNLASWSEGYKDFGEWLKEMLFSGNGLSEDFAERLLFEKRFILLLDGLDELARNEEKPEADKKRAACLEALNNYLDGEKNIICCRIDEFAAMQQNTARDAPVSIKVEVLNLTEAEVLIALEHAQNDKDTKHHASAKNLSELIIKEENAALRKILCTPFYFTIALEVFYKRLAGEINLPKDEKDLKAYLIEKYIERKLDKTPNPNIFDISKTKKWLKWLARLMEKKQLITFELAELQPSDSDKPWFFYFLTSLMGSILGGVVGGIVFGVVSSLIAALVGLFLGFLFSSISSTISVQNIVKLKFSKLLTLSYWKFVFEIAFLFSVLSGLILGLVGGLVGGLVISLSSSGFNAVIRGLLIFLIISLFFGLFFGLTAGIDSLKVFQRVSNLQNPYQKINGSILINLAIALILLLVVTGFTLSLNYFENDNVNFILKFLWYWIIFVPQFWIMETAIYRHLFLRLCFWLENAMPLKYATFLNYAAQARILEKDGGQWRFRHQNLQEYFAKLVVSD